MYYGSCLHRCVDGPLMGACLVCASFTASSAAYSIPKTDLSDQNSYQKRTCIIEKQPLIIHHYYSYWWTVNSFLKAMFRMFWVCVTWTFTFIQSHVDWLLTTMHAHYTMGQWDSFRSRVGGGGSNSTTCDKTMRTPDVRE